MTLATLVALVLEIVPLPVIFLIACAVALVVNYPDPHQQRDKLTDHGSSAMVMVTTVMAAGLFTGIMTNTGMLTAMARGMVAMLPSAALEHLPVVVAVASMPMSLAFDPDSFISACFRFSPRPPRRRADQRSKSGEPRCLDR